MLLLGFWDQLYLFPLVEGLTCHLMVQLSSADGSAQVSHPAGASASSTLHLWGFSLLRKTCPGQDSSYYLQTLSRQQRSYSYIYTYRTFCPAILLLLTGLQIFLHLSSGLTMLGAPPAIPNRADIAEMRSCLLSGSRSARMHALQSALFAFLTIPSRLDCLGSNLQGL